MIVNRLEIAAVVLATALAFATSPSHADTTLAASVLPGSRAVQTGSPATVYASIINAGEESATACTIAAGVDFTGNFQYQTTELATNALTGDPDTPVDIPPSGVQSFALTLWPETTMDGELEFDFSCANAPSVGVLSGINTLWLASSSSPAPDIVALAATTQGDGTVHLDPGTGTGALAVATVNLGATGAITVTAEVSFAGSTSGAAPPSAPTVTATLCRTNSATGQCEQPTVPAPGPLSVTVQQNATPTFSVFVTADAPVAADPAANRVFVRFRGEGGGNRGSTSVAFERSSSSYANWDLVEATAESRGLAQADIDALFDHVYTDVAVQGVLLVYQGAVVGERHAAGRDSASLGTSWSVAKSFYGALVGAAIQDGAIASLDDSVSQYLPAWLGTDRTEVTIRQLLRMRAGLPGNSNGCGNIFVAGDQSAFAESRQLVRPPGGTFQYSNCGSQILEPLLRNATGTDAHSLLGSRLLAPIGIDLNAIGLWSDRTALNPMTYCCIDMTLRDFARFGVLMARGGEWDGNQLLPIDFVAETLRAANSQQFYGLHWWILNAAYFGAAPPVTLAAALGLDGQLIVVWPEQDLVMVILTRYEHSEAQGYVLSSSNFPDTCTARNSCLGASGPSVPSFDRWQLVQLIDALID